MKHLFIYLLCLPNALFAQMDSLNLSDIMDGNNFIGHQPSNIYFKPNYTIAFDRRSIDGKQNLKCTYDIHGLSKKVMCTNRAGHLEPIGKIHYNKSRTIFYYKTRLGLVSRTKDDLKILYHSTQNYSLIKVLNKERLCIKVDGNYFILDHKKGTFRQIINLQKSLKKSNKPKSYLEKQQYELFDYIKESYEKDQMEYSIDSILSKNMMPEYDIGQKSIGLFDINNKLNHIIVRLDDYPQRKTTEVDHHITKSGFTTSQMARAKVGRQDPKHLLVNINLKHNRRDTIDISKLPGIYNKPVYFGTDNDGQILKYKNPKSVIYTQVIIDEDGETALIEIKSYDNKDRWICQYAIAANHLKCIDHQHDEAWIGGPGISGWTSVPGNIGWMNGDSACYYLSEKTGYSHLYQYTLKSGKTKALTKGNFEIHGAELSRNGHKFYITANKTHPGNRGFYQLETKPRKWTPFFEMDGNYDVTVSPDESYLAVRYSYKNKPWDLFFCRNIPGAKLTRITDSQTEQFKSYSWREPKIITFKNQKGIKVHARLFRPDPSKKNGAAIQFVHGAGYLQNAHNWWSGYYREYMFHNLLCDKGYTVIDIDYTASKGYGRDFRAGIYRHMGGQDLDDQIAGRQYLIDQENIDANKIGIYGGSYGGFITIMALLKYPGYFQCGAAIRSVTDWAHYNHPYTSNILNTPQTDSVAYRRSSPIYFAENLEDELLILHGMVDDNVQFQDVVRLNQRFIELGKQSFTMALYPVEPHGFVKTSSWVDEYSRILKLFEDHLQ